MTIFMKQGTTGHITHDFSITKGIGRKRNTQIHLLRLIMLLSVFLTCALIFSLTVYILYQGIPHITWELLTTEPSYISGKIGILPDILNTLYIIIATLIFVLPLGVCAAIYLTEYATNQRLAKLIEDAAETQMCIRDRISDHLHNRGPDRFHYRFSFSPDAQ